MRKAEDQNVKNELLTMTEYAVEQGAFGAPFIIVYNAKGEKDVFFGADRFDHVAKHLDKPWFGNNLNSVSKL